MKLEDIRFDMPPEPIDETNWDIETWREENPMDYFKAVSLVLQANNNVEMEVIFQTIYRIARLYIPDVLYKYYFLSDDETLNMKKFQTLSDGAIYMSPIKDFNDPFDGKGFFYDPVRLSHIERLKAHRGRLIDDFTKYIRGTCFTANGVQSMPMWAHYSGNHTGFCVAYDTKSNLDLNSCTFPVQYTDERVDVTKLMREQAQYINDEIEKNMEQNERITILDDFSLIYIPLLLFNIKHTSWSYEKEFRCTTASNTQGMPYISKRKTYRRLAVSSLV